MKSVIYCRTSTDKQDTSLEIQETKCIKMVELNDYKNFGVFSDKISGKTMIRKGFNQIRELIDKEKIDVLVVYKLDRLTRNLSDLTSFVEEITKKNITLVSIKENIDTSSISGRFFLHLMGCFSAYEREVITNRITESLRQRKITGRKYTGITPYGFICENGLNVVNPEEQKVISKIIEMRNMGTTYNKISEYLNDNQVITRQGNKWKKGTVHSIIKRVNNEKKETV